MSISATVARRAALATLAAATIGLITFAAVGCGSVTDTTGGLPESQTTFAQVQRGRYLVLSMSCAECHNRGKDDPSDTKWLAGYLPGTPGQPFQIGPFQTYPANITPDKTTGIGNFTDRQIFNALRFGLDPSHTPDVVITGTTPGQGNFPATPFYLAPPMPWPSFRHLTDGDIWSIVAYIKHGIVAVNNAVPASGSPPDHWASSYTPDLIGPYPINPYPLSNEVFSP